MSAIMISILYRIDVFFVETVDYIVVLYKPSAYSDTIIRGAPSEVFKVVPNLPLDFEINQDVGVLVRTIDEYMKQPRYFSLLNSNKVR